MGEERRRLGFVERMVPVPATRAAGRPDTSGKRYVSTSTGLVTITCWPP
jgi:hypothetical protein